MISNRYDANDPFRSFASICVTLASFMIASALKDDLCPKIRKEIEAYQLRYYGNFPVKLLRYDYVPTIDGFSPPNMMETLCIQEKYPVCQPLF